MHDEFLGEADYEHLALAVEANLTALFKAMANNLRDGELEENEHLSRHFSFPFNPMFKGVWNTRLNGENADGGITETIAWFKARQAPFFFWWTSTLSTPDDLGHRLEAHGLLSMEAQMHAFAPGIKSTALGAPCMVADLDRINTAALQQVPSEFTLEAAQSEQDLVDFKEVFVAGNEIPEWAGQAWVDATLSLGISNAPWTIYVGRLHGKAVASNILFCGAGVASVYGVATLQEERGKGIGGAITLAPLLSARDQGYKHAVLFATEMGVRAYERIGFRMTSARLNRYLWRAPS